MFSEKETTRYYLLTLVQCIKIKIGTYQVFVYGHWVVVVSTYSFYEFDVWRRYQPYLADSSALSSLQTILLFTLYKIHVKVFGVRQDVH